MAKVNLKSAIAARNQNQRYPITRMVREDPEAAIVISKLYKDPRKVPSYNVQGNREPTNPDLWKLREVSRNTANSVNDSQTALQMLPDLELAAQILISIVLCPKDMMTVETNFKVADDITSPELKGKLTTLIKEYFDNKCDLKSFLQIVLRDVLFETGSYPLAIIPENSVDYAINGYTKFSMESFQDVFDKNGEIKNIGLLGPSYTTNPESKTNSIHISAEAFNTHRNYKSSYDPTLVANINGKNFDTSIRVIDNFNALKIPSINERARELRDNNIINPHGVLNFSLESELEGLKLNDRELTGLLFKDRSKRYTPIESIKTDAELDRMMIGEPLVMHLPSESVIPVFIPGSPEKQIGFFVLLDIDGNPVDYSGDRDNFRELSLRMSSNDSFPSAMLSKVKSAMTGFDCNNPEHLNYAVSVYGEMIEADLLARLRNGKYTNGVAIANKQEIYRIMLARSFAAKSTQLLWVPESLMCYFGFKFNTNGIGKSLLEDLKVINSLRAMITMANVMAMMKNSIARTGVRIKFDPEDPNPQKTLETVVHEILRSRQQIIPWGTINPADIADWAARAGLEFVYEGHPGMPDVGIEFEDKASTAVQPSTDLMEELRKQTAMGLGLSPETLDAALQPEFATSIVRNNIMMSKRAMQLQEVFAPLVSDYITKRTKNTPTLLNDLLNTLYDNFEEINLTPLLKEKVLGNEALKMLVCKQTLKDLIDSLTFSLPKPDNTSLENQVDAIESMDKILESAISAYVSSDFFNEDSAGTMGAKADQIKATIKAYYMRRFMIDNGILPDLAEITETFETGEGTHEIYDSQAKLIKGFVKNFGKFLIDLRVAKGRGNKLMDILGVDDTGSSSSSFSSSTGDTDTDDFFGSSPETPEGSEDQITEEPQEETPEAAPNSEENLTTTEDENSPNLNEQGNSSFF